MSCGSHLVTLGDQLKDKWLTCLRVMEVAKILSSL